MLIVGCMSVHRFLATCTPRLETPNNNRKTSFRVIPRLTPLQTSRRFTSRQTWLFHLFSLFYLRRASATTSIDNSSNLSSITRITMSHTKSESRLQAANNVGGLKREGGKRIENVGEHCDSLEGDTRSTGLVVADSNRVGNWKACDGWSELYQNWFATRFFSTSFYIHLLMWKPGEMRLRKATS